MLFSINFENSGLWCLISKMVTHPRLERGTPWLKVRCSTDWANRSYKGLVGPGRLELPASRLSGVRSNRLSYEPLFGPDGGIWTLDPMVPNHVRYQTTPHPEMAGMAGLEPTTRGFGDHCSTNWTTSPYYNIWILILKSTFWNKLILKSGGPSGTRTPDLPVMSRTL